MNLTEAELDQFAAALEHETPPAWDPDFRVTKPLLRTVAVETAKVQSLQQRIDRLRSHVESGDAALGAAAAAALDLIVTSGETNEAETNEIIADLEATIQAAESGAKITDFTRNILRLAARIAV